MEYLDDGVMSHGPPLMYEKNKTWDLDNGVISHGRTHV